MNNELEFRDYSMLVGKKHEDDWYEWCVFVGSDSRIASRIASVEYTLHPTFTDPIRRIRDRSTRFAVFSNGWGGFTISIDVEWIDGSHTRCTHYLALRADSWPKGPEQTAFETKDEETVYRSLFNEKFRWRKLETIARISEMKEARVAEVLTALEKKDLVRKATFLSIDRKELWAPTAVVGLSPKL